MKQESTKVPAIEAKGLCFSYGNGNAVDGMSIAIEEGEFFGLLGPNGAGKTTTIHLLSSLRKPQQGSIQFFGHSIQDKSLEWKKLMGVVPQEIALYDDLSAIDNLIFWGRLYGLSFSQCRRNAVNLLRMTGLRERAHDYIRTYSGGMKRRINIAAALMHHPRILLMDEPTVGVDPQSRIHIFDMLSSLHKEGLTIIYTTHYMEEVERLCNRVAIIDNGRIIADGSLNDLKSQCQDESMILVEVNSEESGLDDYLSDTMKLHVRREGQQLFVMTPSPQRHLPSLLDHLHAKGVSIARAEIREPNLETVFLKLTGRSLRD